MNIRCLHFDMKGVLPRASFLNRLLPRFARMGVTHLLVEFEDKFPYSGFPAAVHPAAWTKAEFRSFAETCRKNKIGVIPLLQCAGHLDYLFRKPDYNAWREDGRSYQWCVSSPETFAAWKGMLGEILEIFPDCEYFHIGADEIKTDYRCPLCGDDPFGAFVKRVADCCGEVLKRGMTPLVWDDMFRKHESAALDSILSKAILCVWQYRTIEEDLIRRPVEKGRRVWGTCRLESSDRYRGLCSFRKNAENIDAWAKISRKYSLEGVIGTIWGRIQSQTPPTHPLPAAVHAVAYWCEAMKDLPHGRFPERFGREFYGSARAGSAIRYYEFEPDVVTKLLPERVEKNADVFEIVRVLGRLDALFEYADSCLESDRALYPVYLAGMAPKATTRNYLDGVRILRERAEAMKREIDEVLSKYFPPAILAEYKASRFDGLLAENDFQEKIILRAEKNLRM